MVSYRVMVVTEDTALRDILVTLLKNWHFEVFPAADSLDALRQIYQVVPQVIVSDGEIGNYAGFELLPFLRHRFPEMGVIVLVRGQAPTHGSLNSSIADDAVSITPLDADLLEVSLMRVSARYPFRQEDDDSSSASSRSRYDSKLQLAP